LVHHTWAFKYKGARVHQRQQAMAGLITGAAGFVAPAARRPRRSRLPRPPRCAGQTDPGL